MKEQLSSFELKHIVEEFQSLVNGRIENIYHPEFKELVLRVHKGEVGKKSIRIIFSKYMYMASVTTANPQAPSNLCTQLRKHIKGAKITSIEQIGNERVVIISLTKAQIPFQLIIEFFAQGNIILTKENKIVSATLYKSWNDRAIKRHEAYEHPPLKPQVQSLSEDKLFSMTDASMGIAKWLATALGLGGTYAKEIVERLGLEQGTPSNEVDKKKLHKEIIALYQQKASPRVVELNDAKEIIPIELSTFNTYNQQSFATFSEAIDSVFSALIHDKEFASSTGVKDTKLLKIEEILHQQTQQEKGLKEQIDQNTQVAETLFAQYMSLKPLIEQVQAIKSKGEKFKEDVLALPNIISVNPKEKKIKVKVDDQ